MEDLTGALREEIQSALCVAGTSLGSVEYAITQLREELAQREKRATQLREFIRLGDALLGTPVSAPVAPRVVSSKPPTAAQHAKVILAEVGHPMTVADIYQQIAASNGLYMKPSRVALRAALRDNPKVFRNVRHGTYELVAKAKPAAGAWEERENG
jgi:hypothetical protein